ncbi:preprotein translocase subunit Sec61beta [Candidatus Woesearchaeota archaeon]|nr:preprotein translocase subunit Sec61beta [Candidatus Woesearchaeota archaeon]
MPRGDDKIRMPSSTAGITQYYDEVKTKITLRPEWVIALAILVIVIEVFLQIYGNSLFVL